MRLVQRRGGTAGAVLANVIIDVDVVGMLRIGDDVTSGYWNRIDEQLQEKIESLKTRRNDVLCKNSTFDQTQLQVVVSEGVTLVAKHDQDKNPASEAAAEEQGVEFEEYWQPLLNTQKD